MNVIVVEKYADKWKAEINKDVVTSGWGDTSRLAIENLLEHVGDKLDDLFDPPWASDEDGQAALDRHRHRSN